MFEPPAIRDTFKERYWRFVASEHGWLWRAALAMLSATVLFSAAPSIFHDHASHWDTYENKYRTPFAPLAIASDDGSEHGAKLNLRLTVPVLASLLGFGREGTYVLLGLCAVLVCVATPILMLRATQGDREFAFWLSLAVAGGHLLTLYFRPLTGYFDGVAITLVIMCFVFRNGLLQALSAVLALFSDERAIFGLALVPLFHLATDADGARKRGLITYVRYCFPVGMAVLTWYFLRVVFANAFGLSAHFGGVGFGVAASNYNYLPTAIWQVFQAGWAIVVVGLSLLLLRKELVIGLFATIITATGFLAAAMVLDLTRSTTYLTPLIFVAAVGFSRLQARQTWRVFLVLCVVLALVEPNIDLIGTGERSKVNFVWSKPLWITLPADLLYLWRVK